MIMQKCRNKDYCSTDFNALDYMAKEDIVPNLTLFAKVKCSSDPSQLMDKNKVGALAACLGALIAAIMLARLTFEGAKLRISN